MRIIATAALCAAIATASCASNPDSISATYVSPLTYQSYDCGQIRNELVRVGNRVSEVTGQQRRAANNDAVAMGVGLVLFWPALFFLAGGGDQREELARLKGEYDNLQVVATEKRCDFAESNQPASPTS